MPWRDLVAPTAMSRVAVVASASRARRVLLEVADAGVVEPDPPVIEQRPPTERAAEGSDGEARLAIKRPSSTEERHDLALGEASLDRVTSAARHTDRCTLVTGWMQSEHLDQLCERLAPLGGAVLAIRPRRGAVPPTAYGTTEATAALRPLVTTYGTVPYRDIDPTWFAAVTYMFMFGMMFGDVGHGAILIVFGVVAARAHDGRLSPLRSVAPFLIGAGIAAVIFGFLYGEAFGPTGLVPTLWIRPLDEPETLLLTGLVLGSGLMALTFAMASVNRWREGGAAVALYATSGIAGALLFAGTATAIAGWLVSPSWLVTVGLVLIALGLVLTFVGLFAHAGSGGAAIAQALVETFDTVLRLGSNVVSFTRLAAFGLTHAVISAVVWDGTVALWDAGGFIAVVAAIALFVAGNVVAFALGALVAGIQALRLEYYELFSRLFVSEGRPFTPWHIPLDRLETP